MKGDPVQPVVAGVVRVPGRVEQFRVPRVLGLSGSGRPLDRERRHLPAARRGVGIGGEDRRIRNHLARGLQRVALEVVPAGGREPRLVVGADHPAEQVAGACLGAGGAVLVGVPGVAVVDPPP